MTKANSQQPKEKKPFINNQTLTVMVGVLSVILVALLIVSGTLLNTDVDPNPTNPQLGSDPTTSSTQQVRTTGL